MTARKRKPAKRGRPVGWRKSDAKRNSIMVRLSDVQISYVKMLAKEHACSMSDVIRHLIDVGVT